jgi:uncharacterized protein YhfF/catechol 2,3-dioxygenase-like lactoylglutathione lyase family enzyme
VFQRVTLTVADLAASQRFYGTLLGALGHERWGDVAVVAGDAVTSAVHVAFAATSRAQVDACWRAGIEVGAAGDGPPGPRPVYGPTYYGGFLLDPDGNSAEVVHREAVRTDGVVDHLWLRVADLDAAADFYRAVPGIHQVHEVPGERVNFGGGPHGGTFAVVADGRPVTRNLAMAFGGREPFAARDPDGNLVEVLRRAEFGVPGPLRDQLVAAVLAGHKTASTSLLAEWEAEGEPLPRAGERWSVVDSGGRPAGLIEYTGVDTVRLGDVDGAVAHDEGEGYAGVAAWRASHLRFWETHVRPELPGLFPLGDDTPIVVERFRVV